MLVCVGIGRIIARGTPVDFSQRFSRGGQNCCNLVFIALETKKIAFFAEIFKFLPPSDAHTCVSEKVRTAPSKTWRNFKRFNTILNTEILLNLIRKMKYLTDEFQLFLLLHW